MTKNKKKLIIFNKNAYILKDLFFFYLKKFSNEYEIFLITSNSLLTNEIKKSLNHYKRKKFLIDFFILDEKISSLIINKNLNKFLDKFKNSNFQLLTNIPEKMIDFIFLKKIIYNNNIIITNFDNFRIIPEKIESNQYTSFEQNSFYFKKILIYLFHLFFKMNFFDYQKLYLLNLVFPKNKLYLICFNSLTKEIYKSFCPFLNIFTLRRLFTVPNHKRKKNLLILGTLVKNKRSRYLDLIINYLKRDIGYIKKKFGFNKIYLKAHPRENIAPNTINFTKHMLYALKNTYSISIVKNNKSIQEYFKDSYIVSGFASTGLTLAKRYLDKSRVFGFYEASKYIEQYPKVTCGDYKKHNSGIFWLYDRSKIYKKKETKSNFNDLEHLLKNVK